MFHYVRCGTLKHLLALRCVSVTVRLVGNEEEILTLLATVGPLSAAVDASTWNNYVGGVIQFHCNNSINHAVEIVGYDLTGVCI